VLLSKLASEEAGPDFMQEVRHEARRLLYHCPEMWHLSKAYERIPDDWGSVGGVVDEAALQLASAGRRPLEESILRADEITPADGVGGLSIKTASTKAER
jgi:hypothetical protein